MFGTAEREDWKDKYRELLAELESKEGDWRALDETLRCVSSRLAIAAMGRDPRVDGHLDLILQSIKSGAKRSQILSELDALSGAVAEHEKHMAASEAIDLPNFVASLQLKPATQRRFIGSLETGTVASRTAALNALADELNALLKVSAAVSESQDPGPIVNGLLLRLTSHISTVPGLGTVLQDIRKRLRDGVREDEWDALLKALAGAIADVIASLEQEKSELKAFLEEVTQHLAQFEEWTRWNEGEARQCRENTAALGENVENQVHGLHEDIEALTELGDLKIRVRSRLAAIADQIKVFRDREECRLESAEERNAALRAEVNRLKVRTTELAQRCGDQESRLMVDALTGVHTRYAYDQRLQEEFQRWQRHGQPLSFSIWDIDYFKKVNDTYGHQAGDRLLSIVAAMLSRQTRVEDFVARIGGEEFVILFPATPLATAAMLADRLREHIAATDFHNQGTPISVTVSCGVTGFRLGDTPEDVYARADEALYRAKNGGRNLCVSDLG